jgi:membrane associated rhomboid family serine protease
MKPFFWAKVAASCLCLLAFRPSPCDSFRPQSRWVSSPLELRKTGSSLQIKTTRQQQQQQQQQQHPSSLLQAKWDGDDLRWVRRFGRRIQRGRNTTPVKTTLIALNISVFLYQIITTVHFIRRNNPSYWPKYALPIIFDTLIGASAQGPLTRDFAFSNMLSRRQPHRYLSSGFLHGGILHLLLNMDSFRRQPSWLETGLGRPIYLTAFLFSIAAGNIGHLISSADPFDRMVCLGSSGGVCGLYGLMYVSLLKMGNGRAATQIAKGMAFVLLTGAFITNVSNAAHATGFLGGAMIGILFGPNYRKSYSMRRKNSVEYDPFTPAYRQVMGFGVTPTERGLIPIQLLWGAAALALAFNPKFRAIPGMLLQGVLHPGSL